MPDSVNPHDRFFTEFKSRWTGREFAELTLRYLCSAADGLTERDLMQAMETSFPEGARIVTTLAEQWMEQGRQQGLQQGRKEGVQQGLREGLQRGIALGLSLKFGAEGLARLPEIFRIEDTDLLRAILAGVEIVSTLDELRIIYRRDQTD